MAFLFREKSSPHKSDPDILRRHSTFKTYTTSRFTYPSIRVFFRRHAQAEQLPTKPASLPLIVCIHGLGGSVAQFQSLLATLVNISSCLAVDLPGCGRSEFTVSDWDAYSGDALVNLLELIIDEHRDKDASQGVVLVGHSMGTSLCVRLASRAQPHATGLVDLVMGVVAICPVAGGGGSMTPVKASILRALSWIPDWLIDIIRLVDSRGGSESGSVRRYVGEGAGKEVKLMQALFNQQSRTPTFKRMAYNCIPGFEGGVLTGGLAGEKIWERLDIPIFLIGGEKDVATSPSEVNRIAGFLKADPACDDTAAGGRSPQSRDDRSSPPAPLSTSASSSSNEQSSSASPQLDDSEPKTPLREGRPQELLPDNDNPSTPSELRPTIPPQSVRPPKLVETLVMDGASHALLYDPSTSRVLAGLVSDFLAAHVSPRLSLAWQLQYLSREGKWDVKNLEKWQGVKPVSEPIGLSDGKPIFRAMKTLREMDKEHTPAVFGERWAGEILDVIDISHNEPVYDPRGLEKAGVCYHKFPTVSKVPPSPAEVEAFISLVDRIRDDRRRARGGGDELSGGVVGVHCHYGFNRTGYLIVCYLVARCGMEMQEAIDEFALARPKGIRHAHFLDSLFVWYYRGTTVSMSNTKVCIE